MSDETDSKAGNGWVIFTLSILPLIYLLSFGPVMGLAQKHRFHAMENFGRRFYAPVVWLYRNTPLKGTIEAYARFWGVS
jgi:hypothetical protein